MLSQGESVSCNWTRSISTRVSAGPYPLSPRSILFVPLSPVNSPAVPVLIQLAMWAPSVNPHSPPYAFFLTPSQVLWTLFTELSFQIKWMFNHVQVLLPHKN